LGWSTRGRGEQEQGIDVAVLVGCDTDPNMHVGRRMLGVAARADGADHCSLPHGCALGDRYGTEVDERHGIAVFRADRDRQPSPRDCSGEADEP
jgi:hypothetical protein